MNATNAKWMKRLVCLNFAILVSLITSAVVGESFAFGFTFLSTLFIAAAMVLIFEFIGSNIAESVRSKLNLELADRLFSFVIACTIGFFLAVDRYEPAGDTTMALVFLLASWVFSVNFF